jgi:radical SAM superfamily enzyme YgiQ (UPF0313 family)
MTQPLHQTQVMSEFDFPIQQGRKGFRRALMLSPPVYDSQYWARWSQPAGLLRLSTFLKRQGYDVTLIDCMETDQKGFVQKRQRKVNGQSIIVQRDDIKRQIWHYGKDWQEIEKQLRAFEQAPDEVWISSIMTYWWESTRDLVALVRKVFPETQIIVGGMYPTLATQHARDNLGADIIFRGELKAASNEWTDFDLYQKTPSYSIITTSRGCPWDCNYCAARALNDGSNKMRERRPEDVLEEIESKMKMGVRRFGFYEDNALALKGHLQSVLELILERGHKLDLYAPEGFETRLLDYELLKTMKRAGFEKIHLPFETLKWETTESWNRRHASTASFEAALENAIKAGFRPRSEEINAFVLFGLPDEKLEDVMDSVLYVHNMVGSVIPMLFTPVPSTNIYRDQKKYLDSMGWDLQDLNGKFLPFLEYNREKHYPDLRGSDYLQLEALMSVLNSGKVMNRAANLFGNSLVSDSFQESVLGNKNVIHQQCAEILSPI